MFVLSVLYHIIIWYIAVPDAPRSVSAQQLDGATTAAVVMVTWEPVGDSNGHGVILGYQIIYTAHGSEKVVIYQLYDIV